MKTWKFTAGILSVVLSILVLFQSCAAGISNTLEENGEIGGSAGCIVAILLLTGGIVSISTRSSKNKGSSIALIVLFGIAALFGFTMAGSYSDLQIWAVWCLINAVIALFALRGKQKVE